ncbi:MAG: hypothetical protein ABEN55_15030, partial [Bradymonadaceae bacterium]
ELSLGSTAADGRAVRLSFTTTRETEIQGQSLPVDELENVTLEIGSGWTPFRAYSDVTGWVGRVPSTKRETLYVSVSGTIPEGEEPKPSGDRPRRLHVWGTYTIDAVQEGETPDDG